MTTDRDTFAYTACGLNIRSVFPLAGVVTGNSVAVPDLEIRAEDLGGYSSRGDKSDSFVQNGDDVFFVAEEIGAVLIRGGNSIILDRFEKAKGVQALRLSVLEPLLAIALYQRGRLVLHGSAVVLSGRGAVVFVGASGWGKSTTAALLFSHGHRVAGDDIAVIDATAGPALLYPGFPQLKLKTDAVTAIGYDPETLPQAYLQPDKRELDVTRGFLTDPVRLDRIYVLTGDSTLSRPRIETPGRQDALAELLRHSYRIQWLHALSAPGHLRQCAALAGSGMVRRLWTGRMLEGLAGVIEEDWQT